MALLADAFASKLVDLDEHTHEPAVDQSSPDSSIFLEVTYVFKAL
jgi:hypothetical protein